MEYSKKQLLFDEFMNTWNQSFINIRYLLQILESYPIKLDESIELKLIKPEQLYESQLEWIALLAQLDNPIETEFFKPYWVPVQLDEYSFFIDLSSEKYSLFDCNYIPFEPYKWYLNYDIKDLLAFMIELDNNNFDFEKFGQNLKYERVSKMLKHYNKKKKGR